MATEQPIEQGWQDYRAHALKDQETALRFAFFAGAYRMMTILTGRTTDIPDPVDAATTEARMGAIAAEFEAFLKELEE